MSRRRRSIVEFPRSSGAARWSGCLTVVAWAICKPAVPERHQPTFEEMQKLERIDAASLQLSRDGSYLAYSMSGWLWVVPTGGQSTPTKLVEGMLPLWSPTTNRLAYYSRATGDLQLWTIDPQDLRRKQITHLIGGIDPDPTVRFGGWKYDTLTYSWSPNGKELVFSSRLPSRTTDEQPTQRSALRPSDDGPLVLTPSTPVQWTLSGIFVHLFQGRDLQSISAERGQSRGRNDASRASHVSRIIVADIEDGTTRVLTRSNDIAYFEPNWSPDGKTIACVGAPVGSLGQEGAQRTEIYSIDAAASRLTDLTAGLSSAIKTNPAWSPDGRQLAFLAKSQLGHNSVIVIGLERDKEENVTRPLRRAVSSFRWLSPRVLAVIYMDGVSWPLATMQLHEGSMNRIGGRAAIRDSLASSPSGDMAWLQSDPRFPAVIQYLSHVPGSTPSTVVDLNPQVEHWRLSPQFTVRWRNHRGESMEGIVIEPTDRAHKPYPLIVNAYPQIANGFKAEGQVWAAAGYVVFWPNPRGPHVWMNASKSAAFDHAAKGREGWTVTEDDVLSGVDALIARGAVDEHRMALYGFSNGGAVVNQIVTRTSRFKCAISVSAAISADWTSQFLLTAQAIIPAVVGKAPWEDSRAYTELSAVYRLDRVNTPLLLASGDNDSAVLQAIEMFNGLRYLGKDVTMLRYPNQGHELTGHAQEDLWHRAGSFLAKCLRPSSDTRDQSH